MVCNNITRDGTPSVDQQNAPNEKTPSEKVTAKSTLQKALRENAPNENAPKYIWAKTHRIYLNENIARKIM